MNQEEQQIIKELKNLSNEASINIYISPLAAWCLITQIQVAVRHPANTDITAKQSRDIAEQLQSRLELSPTLEAVIHRGWLPEYDAIPFESIDEYAQRVLQREIIEVHNVYTLYPPVKEESAIMTFYRPQNWGNKDDWAYEQFKFEWVQQTKHYINHAHCWYDPKTAKKHEVPGLFGGCICGMVLMPGKPEQLCGNQYLAEEDIWDEEWGEKPKVYLPE